MRALTLQGSKFSIEDVADPSPGEGQILVAPFFNGICGSDLHQRAEMKAAEEAAGGDRHGLPKLVLGHEFSAEIVGFGPNTKSDLKIGDRIVALPFSPSATPMGFVNIGLSVEAPGGTGALSVVDAVRSFRIPESVSNEFAALTEPLAVGLHAANLANRYPGPNIIIGCGPIGLAVLISLRDQGRGPIVAVDFSAERLQMAGMLGADILINPAEASPYSGWKGHAFESDLISPLLPRDFKGFPRGLNIFECTGAGSVLKDITENAPRHSHVIYAGVNMHEVKHVPVLATLRELTVQYSFAYTPLEFRQALDMIERQPETVQKLITRKIGLADAEAMFDQLAAKPSEIKVMIDVRT